MALLLVNFGGPRSSKEIGSFLQALLCDRDVVRTGLPPFLHNWLFSQIAKRRARRIEPDYELIGGGSPIYFDTEEMKKRLGEKLGESVFSFHRYLPATHAPFKEEIERLNEEIIVLPLFPQFTFATTGSIARFFQNYLKKETVSQLRWIPSYAGHPAFISSWQKKISNFLEKQQIQDPILLFSAHGIPQSFVRGGDPYQNHCERTFRAVMEAFPNCLGKLSYQSKFGPGKWLQPYTNRTCEEVLSWNEGRKCVVFVPISFTSDHIETLYEIEHLYLPIIQEKGLTAVRCDALNREDYWVDALLEIREQRPLLGNNQLVRRQFFRNRVVSSLP